MGRRGPPPKPTALKKAQGTYRKDRDPALKERAAPAVPLPPGEPPCPPELTGAARRIWDETAPQLHAAGVLSVVDGVTLAGFCMLSALALGLTARALARPPAPTQRGTRPARPSSRRSSRTVVVDVKQPGLEDLPSESDLSAMIQRELGMAPSPATELPEDASPADTSTEGASTGESISPYIAEARKLWPVVEKLAGSLGLHYAARARA